jgi:hypothetical protein
MPHGTSTIDPSVFYDERARQEPPSERASERQKERKRNNVLSIASEKERKNVWGHSSKGPNRPNRPNRLAPQLNRLSSS